MLQNFTGWHFLIILAVILLLFGAPKLPGLARSLGQSLRIFKGEVKSMKNDNAEPPNDTVVDVSGKTTVAPEIHSKS